MDHCNVLLQEVLNRVLRPVYETLMDIGEERRVQCGLCGEQAEIRLGVRHMEDCPVPRIAIYLKQYTKGRPK